MLTTSTNDYGNVESIFLLMMLFNAKIKQLKRTQSYSGRIFSCVLIIVIRHVKVCSMQHTASQEAVLSNSNMASQLSKRPTRKVIWHHHQNTHAQDYQVGSHNNSASVCPTCCSISHNETIECTRSKWFQWFMEQCCVNADLQLPTKQRERKRQRGDYIEMSSSNNVQVESI